MKKIFCRLFGHRWITIAQGEITDASDYDNHMTGLIEWTEYKCKRCGKCMSVGENYHEGESDDRKSVDKPGIALV